MKMHLIAMKAIAVASLALGCAAFAGTVVDGNMNPYHVPGEKLDSGLGDLPATYDAAEYTVAHVAGEKLDSGLGELSYADVMKYAQ